MTHKGWCVVKNQTNKQTFCNLYIHVFVCISYQVEINMFKRISKYTFTANRDTGTPKRL